MFVLLTSINPRSFYFAEYEILTAILVETKLRGYSLFWGVTRPAKTAQLLLHNPRQRHGTLPSKQNQWFRPRCLTCVQIGMHLTILNW